MNNILLVESLLGAVVFTIIFLHAARKNFGAVSAYGLQSLAIVALIFLSFLETRSISVLLIGIVTLLVKAVMVPAFLMKLINKHKLTFSASTYLNMPLTLLFVASLTALAYSQKFETLTSIVPENRAFLQLSFSAILLSLFLIVNHKGALSQIIGVLSLENSIIAFSLLAGLEQSPGLQIGIIFDITVWFIIAVVFISMIYKHFGSLDVTAMRHLKD